MRRTSLCRICSMVGVFLLSASLGTSSAEPREQPRAERSVQTVWRSAFSRLGELLIVWSENGAGLDPFGGEKPTNQNGNGSTVPSLDGE